MIGPARGPGWRRVGLVVGWGGVLLVIALSLGPAPSVGPDVPMSDKWGHAAAYATLMAWFCGLYPQRAVQWTYFGGFFALGLALEGIQGLLPLRQASALDAVANLIGLMLGLAGMRLAARRRSD